MNVKVHLRAVLYLPTLLNIIKLLFCWRIDFLRLNLHHYCNYKNTLIAHLGRMSNEKTHSLKEKSCIGINKKTYVENASYHLLHCSIIRIIVNQHHQRGAIKHTQL